MKSMNIIACFIVGILIAFGVMAQGPGGSGPGPSPQQYGILPGANISFSTNQRVITISGTGGGGGGTNGVTSVGVAGDNTVLATASTGSPVTSNGTITLVLKSQNPNIFLAGPTNGAAAKPTFRAIAAVDIPAHSTPVSSITNIAVVYGTLTSNSTTFNFTYSALAFTPRGAIITIGRTNGLSNLWASWTNLTATNIAGFLSGPPDQSNYLATCLLTP
jgi:hypothetical protein